MSVVGFAFYLFALCTVTGGLFTVVSRNPVHSVLWLILTFLSSAGLFVLLGAEFGHCLRWRCCGFVSFCRDDVRC